MGGSSAVSPPSSSPVTVQREWLTTESALSEGEEASADASGSSSQFLVKTSTYVVSKRKAATRRFSRQRGKQREGDQQSGVRLSSVAESSGQQAADLSSGSGSAPMAEDEKQYVVEERTLISVRGGNGKSGLLERLGRGLMSRQSSPLEPHGVS